MLAEPDPPSQGERAIPSLARRESQTLPRKERELDPPSQGERARPSLARRESQTLPRKERVRVWLCETTTV